MGAGKVWHTEVGGGWVHATRKGVAKLLPTDK